MSNIDSLRQYIELFHYNGIADFFIGNSADEQLQNTETSDQTVIGNTLDHLKKKYQDCKNCDLYSTRWKFVYGEGSINAKMMVVGNPPVAAENINGKPFVGEYGLLFNKMMAAINFDRSNLYITNITKCRTDSKDLIKIQKCMPYLLEQIQIVKPKLILVMGLLAANVLFNKNENMEFYRERQPLFLDDIPVIVTYNPQELLDNANLKKLAWIDLQKILNYDFL